MHFMLGPYNITCYNISMSENDFDNNNSGEQVTIKFNKPNPLPEPNPKPEPEPEPKPEPKPEPEPKPAQTAEPTPEPVAEPPRSHPMVNWMPSNEPQKDLVFRDKPSKKPLVVGIICTIVGIIIGGAGIFGLMQLLNSNKNCIECDCAQTSNTKLLSSLDTSFLALEPQGGNLIYSPLSIRYGLSLLDAGASGTTEAEISKVLGNSELPKYQNVTDQLSLANAVFIRNTFENDVLQSYTNTVTSKYDAEILYDDFTSSNSMDQWVSNKTFGLINSIGIQPNQDTKMVLTNALAIQMDWQHQFDTDDTTGRTFLKENNTEIEATAMSQVTKTEDISYYIDDKITLLSMPLTPTNDAELEFIAVMPEGNLTDYISALDLTTIDAAIKKSTPASKPEDGIEIHIPKFKFDYELNFKDDLESLGIKRAFSDKDADFSKMASKPLYLSDAIHKANIDFSEDGIKAAAITTFAMVANAAMAEEDIPQPTIVNINHPFLFLIRDKNTGTIWFTGTVYEPNLWSEDSANYSGVN